jgi:hypothetical protein
MENVEINKKKRNNSKKQNAGMKGWKVRQNANSLPEKRPKRKGRKLRPFNFQRWCFPQSNNFCQKCKLPTKRDIEWLSRFVGFFLPSSSVALPSPSCKPESTPLLRGTCNDTLKTVYLHLMHKYLSMQFVHDRRSKTFRETCSTRILLTNANRIDAQ